MSEKLDELAAKIMEKLTPSIVQVVGNAVDAKLSTLPAQTLAPVSAGQSKTVEIAGCNFRVYDQSKTKGGHPSTYTWVQFMVGPNEKPPVAAINAVKYLHENVAGLARSFFAGKKSKEHANQWGWSNKVDHKIIAAAITAACPSCVLAAS